MVYSEPHSLDIIFCVSPAETFLIDRRIYMKIQKKKNQTHLKIKKSGYKVELLHCRVDFFFINKNFKFKCLYINFKGMFSMI